MGLLVLISWVLFLIGLLQLIIDKRQVLIGQVWLGALSIYGIYQALGHNWTLGQIEVVAIGIAYLVDFWIVFSNLVFSFVRGYVFEDREKKRLTSQFMVLLVLAVLLIVFLVTYFGPLTPSLGLRRFNSFLSLILIYLAFQAIAFLSYAQIYGLLGFAHKPSYILVLGQKLADGQMGKSLRNRLDKALTLWEKSPQNTKIIVSGGIIDPEWPSEASLMKTYLLEAGLDEADIIVDEAALNTIENFENTAELIEQAQIEGSGVFVTSSYHVLRSAILAREFELDLNGVASKPDNHGLLGYVFAKYVREFYGFMSLHLFWHGSFCLFFAILAWVLH